MTRLQKKKENASSSIFLTATSGRRTDSSMKVTQNMALPDVKEKSLQQNCP